ncbi:Fgfr1 oncogene partner [Operophtera brumata]|uniref:Fgfr1 oncogene partner n=1 Tax=Operophtera brumata TaxID=104452 RepID=A0A0L7KNU0_OPEBR|nr:Fgfr1 oncogene partner [Operophtera brumata]
MAQPEDTELRDLVIEALEKNGSLAKICALLRANIYLAFEDDYENIRQNANLDNLLKLPEGVLALTIVHEFLESCSLKNTLFVYKSESRQGNDYKYHGKKHLADKLCLGKQDNPKEPVLVTLIRNLSKSKYGVKQSKQRLINKHGDSGNNSYKDEQNSSYIVHEDSQSNATNTSQSDNSLDEKNKLHLRLQLDNSDTDTSTSTDSTRDKSSSEYIPSDHILEASNSHNTPDPATNTNEKNTPKKEENNMPYFTKFSGNNSSDSTSYVDLKPFSSLDEKALNTMGLPYTGTADDPQLKHLSNIQNELQPKDSGKSATLSSVSSLSLKNESIKDDFGIKTTCGSSKSDGETAEYTYDFTTSQGSKKRGSPDKPKSPKLITDTEYKTSPTSPHQNSNSSVSISNVADLISEKSSSFDQHSHSEKSFDHGKSMLSSNNSKKKSGSILNKHSDDSEDFTESPIPSLSNLSLDIHSD